MWYIILLCFFNAVINSNDFRETFFLLLLLKPFRPDFPVTIADKSHERYLIC